MDILGLVILAVLGILTIPFTLHIRAQGKNTYFNAEISVKLFGYVLFKRARHGDWLDLIVMKLRRTPPQAKEEQSNGRSAPNIVLVLIRAGRWKQFIWEAEIGLDDASQTAIVVGGILGLQTILLKVWLGRTFSAAQVICQPNYREPIVRNHFRCIVTFRFGNIIKEIVGGYIKEKWRKAI